MLKNFRTYQLSLEFYHLASKIRMQNHLKDQLLRAASSVSLNLAEGAAKRTPKDRRKFYNIAQASMIECSAIFDLNKIEDKSLRDLISALNGSLYNLVRYYENKSLVS